MSSPQGWVPELRDKALMNQVSELKYVLRGSAAF